MLIFVLVLAVFVAGVVVGVKFGPAAKADLATLENDLNKL